MNKTKILIIGSIGVFSIVCALLIALAIISSEAVSGNSGSALNLVMATNTVDTSPSPTPPVTVLPNVSPVPWGTPVGYNATNKGAVGIPAIKPRPDLKGLAITFTEQEVKDFVKNNPLSGRIETRGAINLEMVEFLTGKDISTKFNLSTGQPDNRQLCYVKLTGNFVISDRSGNQITYKYAYQIFDAETGNLLIQGATN
jgi:hypothetical protein